MLTKNDLIYLERCVELAKEAVDKGDEPFGSVLVSKDGRVLMEDHNHVAGGDHTQHPEFNIARWAANHMSPEDRKSATVYTSGEHCPMCAAAHAWVGLGRIVYASSSKQLVEWMEEMGEDPSPVKNLAIEDVIRHADVAGPAPEFAERIKQLHLKSRGKE